MVHIPPQPSVERLPQFARQPIVVGLTPEPSPVLVHAAVSIARALDAPRVCFAYADPARVVIEEHPDGSVTHAPLDPDLADEGWQRTRDALATRLDALVSPSSTPWELHYLAGRPDRALTHLARAVDASMMVVGARGGGWKGHVREALEGSVSTHLSQHQHRPVVTIPLSVVDWKDPVAR